MFRFISLSLFCLFGLCVFFLYRYSLGENDLPPHIKTKKNLEAGGELNFSFRDIKEKKVVNVSQFFGTKWVLINFWATWCGPCVEELPSLIRLAKMFSSKLVVLALSSEREQEVEHFLKKMSYPSFSSSFRLGLVEAKNVASLFKVRVMPVSFLFSPKGNLLKKIRGARVWDSKKEIEKMRVYFMKQKEI